MHTQGDNADKQYARSDKRQESDRFYGGKAWRKFRAYIKAIKPMLCVDCGGMGNQLDHVVPRLERPEWAYDEDNVEWRCRTCHNVKRARE